MVFASASRISCAHSKSFSFFVKGQLRAKKVLLDFRAHSSSYAFVPFLAVLCVLYYIIVRNVQCIIVACSCSIPQLSCRNLNLREGHKSRRKLFKRADVVDEGAFLLLLLCKCGAFKCADVRC